MELLERIADELEYWIWTFGIPAGEETIPIVVIALLGTGIFLTLRLGFIQFRRLGHGFAVTSGIYDDPDEPGDVSHFQALTTALSATVGIGNIAGVAIAIHWGGPGALFWMWATALVGMATKFSEVTLAQRYRSVDRPDKDPRKWEGTVSGGPMYYIERGLGSGWKPLGVFFAVMLGITAFFTGNAIQANTVADTMKTTFGIAPWFTGLVTAGIVALVIVGGITRIGKVTGILAPLMAAIYILGALIIILSNYDKVLPTFGLIFREAFNPTAGVAGTGVGAFLVTMMWGVRKGLFSNEAGQGSAPIAHAAAKTDEPVSEGVVALVEPFIDTIVIVTMTALVIIITGVWKERVPTEITLGGGDITWVAMDPATGRAATTAPPEQVRFESGSHADRAEGAVLLAWHEVPMGIGGPEMREAGEDDRLYEDPEHARLFTGTVFPLEGRAESAGGESFRSLHGDAVESAAPLTMLGFGRILGHFGRYIVLISVLLFAISTAIAWSYYGDRCANYLLGERAIFPYKIAFIAMHYVGAVLPLATIWRFGEIFLGIVIIPNLVALILLSREVCRLNRSYFERRPWVENREAHRRAVRRRKARG